MFLLIILTIDDVSFIFRWIVFVADTQNRIYTRIDLPCSKWWIDFTHNRQYCVLGRASVFNSITETLIAKMMCRKNRSATFLLSMKHKRERWHLNQKYWAHIFDIKWKHYIYLRYISNAKIKILNEMREDKIDDQGAYVD